MSRAAPSRRSLGFPRLPTLPTPHAGLDLECWMSLLRQTASALDRLLIDTVRDVRLHWFAAKVSRDPDNAAWVAQVRKRVTEGISGEDLIGHDGLEERKHALKCEQ